MKKFFKYNVGAAIGALVLIIALALFGGMNRTVASYSGKVDRAFDSSSGSVSLDLKKYKDYAVSFSAKAKAAGCATSALDESVGKLDAGSAYTDSDRALEAISSAAAVVYGELEAKSGIGEDQKRSAKSDYYEMTSTADRLLKNDAYNNAAKKYNKAVSSFPANILTFGRHRAAVFNK
ncbi:MAG: hypothetical protein J5879_01855 [Clostridia bacterium]|nr:hypothetical protein [Clostridia bacterium]